LRYQTFIVFGDYAKKEWSNKKLGFSNSSISAGYDTKDDETLPIFFAVGAMSERPYQLLNHSYIAPYAVIKSNFIF